MHILIFFDFFDKKLSAKLQKTKIKKSKKFIF